MSAPSRDYSLLDVAPTAARVLGLTLPKSDGMPIEPVEGWGCRNVLILVIDSLGYDLLLWLLPRLHGMRSLAEEGMLLRAEAVASHTTPAIATILSGLLPENHGILDKAGAKESSILSIPEIASESGLRSGVIMESNGAEVYEGLIEIVGGIPDHIPPEEFDRRACSMTLEALSQHPRLLVSYFIGIDKAAHDGKDAGEIREAAMRIDGCISEIAGMADEDTLLILCGDHPIHAGRLKRCSSPYSVALILARGRGGKDSAPVLR